MNIRLGVAALAVAGGAIIAGAAPALASDGPPSNYGGCVSTGSVFPISPSTSPFGPFNIQAAVSSGTVTGAVNGSIQSDGNSRFSGGVACS